MKRAVYALMCLALSGCGASMSERMESAMTDLAHGANAMYAVYEITCGTPALIVSKDCQKAAKYYEFAVCQFERVNHYMGGPQPAKACEP